MSNFVKKIIFTYWQNFHAIRKIELGRIKRFIDMEGKATVLDLGCGKGFFCQVLHKYGNRVFGIDPIKKEIDIAKQYLSDGISLAVGFGEDLPYKSAQFDKVVSVCVLEHVGDDKKVLREVSRVLKRKGIFVFSVDSLNSGYTAKNFIENYKKKYRINHLYDEAKIRRLLDENGFEAKETEYLFGSLLSAWLLRFGSYFHYKNFFICLFPIIYPLLWIDDNLNKNKKGGMVMVVNATKREEVPVFRQ